MNVWVDLMYDWFIVTISQMIEKSGRPLFEGDKLIGIKFVNYIQIFRVI